MTPTLTLYADPVPLRLEGDGTARVGSSNVTLDLIIREFDAGQCPQAIVRSYDTLKLEDVYAVINYYLHHREEVAAYMTRQKAEADAVRKKMEAAGMSNPNFGQELLARRARMENGSVPPGNR